MATNIPIFRETKHGLGRRKWEFLFIPPTYRVTKKNKVEGLCWSSDFTIKIFTHRALIPLCVLQPSHFTTRSLEGGLFYQLPLSLTIYLHL